MQPQYPQYPVMPAYPPQAYPQVPPQYAQPQYAQPQYAQPQYPPQQYVQPPQPTVPGSLDAFFDQPSTGSKAWVFKDRPIGTRYAGIVERAVNSSDVRQQTDQQGKGQTYRDGRPKFVMVVPMLVQPSAEFPEGQASWWVKGQARDELKRAMAEAGAPEGPPEAGAAITVTLIGQRPIPGMNPAYQYRVTYVRPQGAPQYPVNPPPASAPPVPVGAPWPQGGYYGPTDAARQQPPPQQPPPQQQPQYMPGMEGQPIPALNIGPTVTPPVASQTAPPQAPNNLTPEQQELLARLIG